MQEQQRRLKAEGYAMMWRNASAANANARAEKEVKVVVMDA
jgi:hypothetical protein